MTSASKTTRRQAISDMKRGLILEAASRVFERDGLEGATVRAIAKECGYTAAALYFHFESKEDIYAALLKESLDELGAAIHKAAADADAPNQAFLAASLAFFDFYATRPRDLDLGFYLYRGGMKPTGLGKDRDEMLNAALISALEPIGNAARGASASNDDAHAMMTEIFAHASGLLLLSQTGRIRLFGADARAMMGSYLAALSSRLS